jgi:hypothetical protein
MLGLCRGVDEPGGLFSLGEGEGGAKEGLMGGLSRVVGRAGMRKRDRLRGGISEHMMLVQRCGRL